MYSGLLLGRRKKVKFHGIFSPHRMVVLSRTHFCSCPNLFVGIFADIFGANFAKQQSVKNDQFCGNFLEISLEINTFCADLTRVFNVF